MMVEEVNIISEFVFVYSLGWTTMNLWAKQCPNHEIEFGMYACASNLQIYMLSAI